MRREIFVKHTITMIVIMFKNVHKKNNILNFNALYKSVQIS